MSSTESTTYTTSIEAVPTHQDDVRLFVGVAKAKDLIRVTTVDHYRADLDPTDPQQGYQRPPERSRITKIGKFLISGGGDRLFPTALLLAARKPLEYDRKAVAVMVSSDEPLQIVDGQHRLAGLKYAIEEKGAAALGEYEIPVVIMETGDKRLAEMNQFRIVNGTAKQVRTDLVNMILTAIYADSERADVPKGDLWRIVVSNVVDRLAKDPESPWRDLISLPGDPPGDRKPVRATSLITSLRPVYVWLKDPSGILDRCRDTDEEIDFMYDLVVSYWRALRQVVPGAFDEPLDYVIQKTPGVFSLHMLLRRLLGDLYHGRRSFDTPTFAEFLAESPEITDSDFWSSTASRASVYGSMKGFQELYEILAEAYA